MGHRPAAPGNHRQTGLCPIERLDLTLLVGTDCARTTRCLAPFELTPLGVTFRLAARWLYIAGCEHTNRKRPRSNRPRAFRFSGARDRARWRVPLRGGRFALAERSSAANRRPPRWQGDAGLDFIAVFRPERSYRCVSVNSGGKVQEAGIEPGDSEPNQLGPKGISRKP
jgi:hypothetical protein